MCELLNIPRSTVYYHPKAPRNNDTVILNEVRDVYEEAPFYGYRRILVELRKRGFEINHKRLQSLLSQEGIQAVYPKKKTTIRNLQHKVHPYLLRGLCIERPNQVWAVDITYIKIHRGFVYLTCLIDIFSRKIMGWSLSTFLDTQSCLEALKSALMDERPDIINSDQGCQFTSDIWIDFLTQHGIKISMDGKGRWVDNKYIERLWRTIKYENVFLHSFDTVAQTRKALHKFIEFYNHKRPHQTLNYHTPDAIFNLGTVPSKHQLFEDFKVQSQATFMEASMIS
jgi:putative transposase